MYKLDFRKYRGARDQIANICWIIEKAKEFNNLRYAYNIILMEESDEQLKSLLMKVNK